MDENKGEKSFKKEHFVGSVYFEVFNLLAAEGDQPKRPKLKLCSNLTTATAASLAKRTQTS